MKYYVLALALVALMAVPLAAADTLQLATFDIDATPPVGSQMAYDPVIRRDDLPLRCRGLVLLGAGRPIVMCAVDWIGIANEGHDAFRNELAEAAGTTPERVALHTLHQHDAPVCDLTAERLLREVGAADLAQFDGKFARETIARAAAEVRTAIKTPQTITHVGWGAAEVHEVASNRRILDASGKVRATRYTATKDPALRAEPEGTIDPEVTLVSFWNGERPVAVLSYYACHPQSYYRTGIPNPDFPGIARFVRGQAVPEALHVHFNGAGGNIGAGKYNDGSKENRVLLAMRLADGMKRAWEATDRKAISPADVEWQSVSVPLPPASHLDEAALREKLKSTTKAEATAAADDLAWLVRCQAGHKIDIPRLNLGEIRIVHLPGELFVEYQLAAKSMRPGGKVCLAAYGDYGPGYIGTERAYGEGGYETSARASSVAPGVEKVLLDALTTLLK